MKTYKIIIPGVVRTKKNGMTFSMFYMGKNGQRIMRDRPITILKQEYRDWCKIAVEKLVVFKTRYPEDEFPLRYGINLQVVSFIPTGIGRLDQSATYEGIQDVLCGKSSQTNSSVPPQLFQLLIDDSYQYIRSHDGSRIYIDCVNPRMEITMEPFIK